MKVDDILERLESCGLSEKEARAFAHLTRLGTSKVTDLATAADLKRPETYQILERLQSRGLVEGTLTRPRTFTAIPPERAIDILVQEREQGLKAIERMREDLVERLSRLGGGQTTAQAETFRILHDRNQITGQLSRTLRTTQQQACAVASSRSLYRLLLDEGLEKDFVEANARGVRVRILTEILPGQEEVLERLSRFADVRHMMVPRPLRFFVGDEREIVQYVIADPVTPGAKETALWIGARDHVQAQRSYFDDMWTLAMPGPARLEELRTGRAPEQVQVVKGRLTRMEKQKEMALRAQREIVAILAPGEPARLHASGLARVLASRIREGVRVRLLVPEGSDVTLAGAQVRESPLQEALPMVVVDGEEALLVLTGKGAADDVAEVAEYGVWLSLAPSVRTLVESFEKRWVGGAPGAGS